MNSKLAMLTNTLNEDKAEERIDIEEKARDICVCVASKGLPEGKILLCDELNGKDAPKHSLRLMYLKKGQVCIATNIRLIGTVDYEFSINLTQMYNCPCRTTRRLELSED
jgi:hypothetical protein